MNSQTSTTAERTLPDPFPSDPRYRVTHLRAGRLLLDAGGMFGLIPKVVWSRTRQPDEQNRLELHHNCLLLEALSPADDHPRKLIIETGTGDKLDAKMASIFGLDGTTVESALTDAGHHPADIDAVIVSHLHFDHAGGLTRRVRTGESPDWTAPDKHHASGDSPEVKLTFPNARVHVQQREWNDALANDSVMTRTYYPDHLLPLQLPLPDGSPRLALADSPRPFPLGITPHRDELPKTPIHYRMTEIAPGIRVFLVPGHTWGQQAVTFLDEQARRIVFTPDVLPSAAHVGMAYSLAYDVEPYTSMISKHWLLEAAASHDWLLFLDHEPANPLRRVTRTDKGWFDLPEA
ncbi:MAG: MBL fold metallo-hydrolase [Phycisphaerales bacterium JB037]